MNRTQMADQIVATLEREQVRLAAMYASARSKIGYFYVDDVLDASLAATLFANFPPPSTMRLKKSLREKKFIAAQMNNYAPILEEAIYAFQDPRVVSLIAKICDIKSLYPDVHLYAGGISLMADKQFLNPHIDNSHDKDRARWRVLNLLYYVTPDWPTEQGGNLELWPDGMSGEQITLHSKFNRLVVMATHDSSWHSVSPISVAGGTRCCVSNYYFSDESLKQAEQFHITFFRGRPEQKVRDLILQTDGQLRTAIRKIFKRGLVENKHVYKRPD